MSVTNIPTGPANVVQRLLAFTAEGGASFYHVPASMVLNDYSTTSLEVDFSDTILLSGISMDYLFAQIELPDQLGVIDYAERLFWWGERSKCRSAIIFRSTVDGTPSSAAVRSAGNSIRPTERAAAGNRRTWCGATRIELPATA